jgi:hypothetical protein
MEGFMHPYVNMVISQIDPRKSQGCGGYLRIRPGAKKQACAFLIKERNAAQTWVDKARISGPLLNAEVPMQMLILTQLMLTDPDTPVDIRAVVMAQLLNRGYVSKRIENAVRGLVLLSDGLLEVVTSL